MGFRKAADGPILKKGPTKGTTVAMAGKTGMKAGGTAKAKMMKAGGTAKAKMMAGGGMAKMMAGGGVGKAKMMKSGGKA